MGAGVDTVSGGGGPSGQGPGRSDPAARRVQLHSLRGSSSSAAGAEEEAGPARGVSKLLRKTSGASNSFTSEQLTTGEAKNQSHHNGEGWWSRSRTHTAGARGLSPAGEHRAAAAETSRHRTGETQVSLEVGNRNHRSHRLTQSLRKQTKTAHWTNSDSVPQDSIGSEPHRFSQSGIRKETLNAQSASDGVNHVDRVRSRIFSRRKRDILQETDSSAARDQTLPGSASRGSNHADQSEALRDYTDSTGLDLSTSSNHIPGSPVHSGPAQPSYKEVISNSTFTQVHNSTTLDHNNTTSNWTSWSGDHISTQDWLLPSNNSTDGFPGVPGPQHDPIRNGTVLGLELSTEFPGYISPQNISFDDGIPLALEHMFNANFSGQYKDFCFSF